MRNTNANKDPEIKVDNKYECKCLAYAENRSSYLLMIALTSISVDFKSQSGACGEQRGDMTLKYRKLAFKRHFNSTNSSHHVGTLCKSFTRSYLWRVGVKLRHSTVLCRERFSVVVDLKRRYRNNRMNE